MPVGFLTAIQVRNFMLNKTSNERFARSARTQSAVSELDSEATYERSEYNDDDSMYGGRSRKDRGKKSCFMNCRRMCFNKTIISQERLLQKYLAEDDDESSKASILDD